MKTVWNKKIEGNKQLVNAPDPLRNFLKNGLQATCMEQNLKRPVQLLNLSEGDPTTSVEFRTHKDNLQHLAECTGLIDYATINEGQHKARSALAQKYSTANQKLTCQDVYLTNGGTMALWAVINLLGSQGDNFLFPSPGYPVMLGMANMIGMQPRLYNLDKNCNWQANIEQMQNLIDQKTKFILVIDPSNPLGSVWSTEYKREIIKLCIRKNVALLADEIYELLGHQSQVIPFAQLLQPHQVNRIMIYKCSGLAKVYLGPGWRMGWLIIYGSQKIRKIVRKYLRGMFSIYGSPTTIVQAALPNIMNNPNNLSKINDCIGLMRKNKQILKQQLQNEQYCLVGNSLGSIFTTILMNLQFFQLKQIGEDIIDFTSYLYAEQNIIVYPGVLFTGEIPFIRIMISCSAYKIEEFVLRFKRFCRKHLKKFS